MPTHDNETDALQAAAEAVTALQARVTAVESKGKKLDSLDTAMIEKAASDAADALTFVQEIGGLKRYKEMQSNLEAQAAEVTELKTTRTALEKALDEQKDRVQALELGAATGQVKGGIGGSRVITEYAKSLHDGLNSAERGVRNISLDRALVEENAKGMVDYYFPYMKDEKKAGYVKALVGGSGPDGGYWLPVERQQRMITRIFESTPMRQLANIITTGTNMVELVIDDGEITADWGTELSPHGETATPQIGLLKIPVHHLRARPKVTESMLEDSTIDVVSWLTDKVERDMARAESTAFVSGNGADRPLGFLTMASASNANVYQRNTLGRVASGVSASIGADSMFNVQNHLKEPYQSGAVWLMQRRTFFTVATLKDLQNQYLLRFGDMLASGTNMTLLGKRVIFADDMPALASSSQSIAYGDFGQSYQIVDRVGISVMIDPYTDDPFIRYRFRKRVGGGVINFEGIKILQCGA
jgi:HK97 family phage major capsid protein